MSQDPFGSSLEDLAAALDADGDVTHLAPRPTRGPGRASAFEPTGWPGAPVAQPPSGNYYDEGYAEGYADGYADEQYGHTFGEPADRGVTVDDLPATMRHLHGELRRLQEEHMPLLRRNAVPGCAGCRTYDDSYLRLLRHLVALQDAAVVATQRLKDARGRYAQAMREAFTEQADQFENLSATPVALEELSDAEQANLIPTFAVELRERTLERADRLAESTRSEMQRRIDTAERERDRVMARLDHMSRQLEQVRVAFAAGLGASNTLVEQFLNGGVDLPTLLATILGNAGGAVKLNSAHAALWISDRQPDGPIGEMNASPTTLNSALQGGDTDTAASRPAPSAPASSGPSRAARPGAAPSPSDRRDHRGGHANGGEAKPAGPPASVVAARKQQDEEDAIIRNLLQILSRRGALPASVFTAQVDGMDSDRLKRIIANMNMKGAAINYIPADGDGLVGVGVAFMGYYEAWFERFSETDEEHRSFLGWITALKTFEHTQISGVAPALNTMLKTNWKIAGPVRFDGTPGPKSPVGLHLVRDATSDTPSQNALLIYVPDPKLKALPKAKISQDFDAVFLYAQDPKAEMFHTSLNFTKAFGISRAAGVASDPAKWTKLVEK